MIDKVQKIKDWISKTQDCLMDDNGNFENTSDEGAFHILSNLDYYIDSLQEEPVSKGDFEMALTEMVDEAQRCVVEPWVIAAQWKDELIKLAKSEEPVSDELEAFIKERVKNIPIVLRSGFHELCRQLIRDGAKWQRQKDQKWIDDNRQQIFNEGYKNGSYAGRCDMYNRLFEAAATDRVVTHFLLAHSV